MVQLLTAASNDLMKAAARDSAPYIDMKLGMEWNGMMGMKTPGNGAIFIIFRSSCEMDEIGNVPPQPPLLLSCPCQPFNPNTVVSPYSSNDEPCHAMPCHAIPLHDVHPLSIHRHVIFILRPSTSDGDRQTPTLCRPALYNHCQPVSLIYMVSSLSHPSIHHHLSSSSSPSPSINDLLLYCIVS